MSNVIPLISFSFRTISYIYKNAERGSQEHKLFLYADDILLLLRDPISSISPLMETVQKFSKISRYRVNWHKSEAMPISANIQVCRTSVLFLTTPGRYGI